MAADPPAIRLAELANAVEDPADIAQEIVSGAQRVDPSGERHRVILDRFTAVETALGLARAGDAVLLAGKGHEECQVVDGRRVAYRDRRAVHEVRERRGVRMGRQCPVIDRSVRPSEV